jgi:UDP-MurNAc hydroxylase
MKVTKIASSTIIIQNKDIRLLCDPWVENGEYYGSWSLVEKINLKKAYEKMNLCDAIYISHIHPDHFSPKTMRKLNIKDKKIFIHSYSQKFLKKNLHEMGFNNIIEIKNGERINVNGKTSIAIYAADNCNPEMCRKFYACNYGEEEINKESQQIDTCMVINDEKNTLVNLNDCMYPIMTETIKKIKFDYKKVNLLLLNYNSAHSYPQCISNYSKSEKLKISEKLKKLSLQKSINFIEDFKPDFFIPIAGEYLLSGKLFEKNKYTGMNSQDECYNFFFNSSYYKNFVMLNYGSTFNLETKKKIYYINEQERTNNIYLKKVSLTKFPFEENSMPSKKEIENLTQKSFQRFSEKIKSNNIFFDFVVYIKYFEKYAELDLKNNSLNFVKKINTSIKNYIVMTLDERLLELILKGPKFAHWNNADIGSHIEFYRSNAEHFNSQLGNYLSYFHS